MQEVLFQTCQKCGCSPCVIKALGCDEVFNQEFSSFISCLSNHSCSGMTLFWGDLVEDYCLSRYGFAVKLRRSPDLCVVSARVKQGVFLLYELARVNRIWLPPVLRRGYVREGLSAEERCRRGLQWVECLAHLLELHKSTGDILLGTLLLPFTTVGGYCARYDASCKSKNIYHQLDYAMSALERKFAKLPGVLPDAPNDAGATFELFCPFTVVTRCLSDQGYHRLANTPVLFRFIPEDWKVFFSTLHSVKNLVQMVFSSGLHEQLFSSGIITKAFLEWFPNRSDFASGVPHRVCTNANCSTWNLPAPPESHFAGVWPPMDVLRAGCRDMCQHPCSAMELHGCLLCSRFAGDLSVFDLYFSSSFESDEPVSIRSPVSGGMIGPNSASLMPWFVRTARGPVKRVRLWEGRKNIAERVLRAVGIYDTAVQCCCR